MGRTVDIVLPLAIFSLGILLLYFPLLSRYRSFASFVIFWSGGILLLWISIKGLEELMHTYQVDWQQATRILADRNSTDAERYQAAERIQVDLDREGDNGLWDWILEGDWTGKETLQSVKDELAEVEE